MEDGDSISHHITQLETAYSHICFRCSSSARPEAIALWNFLSVEQLKVLYLFLSLPTSFKNVNNNLDTKETLGSPMLTDAN